MNGAVPLKKGLILYLEANAMTYSSGLTLQPVEGRWLDRRKQPVSVIGEISIQLISAGGQNSFPWLFDIRGVWSLAFRLLAGGDCPTDSPECE